MCICFISYMPYMAAQLWPSFYSMVPTGFILGLGGGILWCAICVYVAAIAEAYSKIHKISLEVIFPRFLCIFFVFYNLSEVSGNLVSSLVLSSDDNEAAVTSLNASQIPELCGANFLPSADAHKALLHQPPEKIQMLVGIYIACMIGAVIVLAVGVDPMDRYKTKESKTTTTSGLALLTVTVKLLAEPNQLLLIAMSMFVGMQNVFFSASISAAFVSCSIGTGTVGYVMMAHGIADVFGSASTAYLVKIVKRVVLISTAAAIYLILFIFLLVWRPQANSDYVLYIVSTLWGYSNSTFLIQVNAYHGILFPDKKEAAFANFRLWKAIGYVIAYVTSHYMRVSHKIYMLLALYIVGLLGYYVTEYRESVRKSLEKRKESLNGCVNIGFK
ncbi:UNC93-like protein isoform X2 [Pectinophora gossypiella]|nr:UNC93-like protein isoform X2 [Pectinophora gossypiella]